MDGTHSNDAPPPPPLAPVSRTPPISPSESNSKTLRGSPVRRPPLGSSAGSSSSSGLPPRGRPSLVRGDSARGSFRGHTPPGAGGSGSGGLRDRRDSHHSVGDQGSHGSRGSTSRRNSYGLGVDQPVTSDAALLLASLDKNNENVEDEAEAYLLDVLESRHVTFAAPHRPSGHRHRRYQSAYQAALPNIDLLNLGSNAVDRPSSASSAERQSPIAANLQPLMSSRPGLPSRSISHGRSKRNLLHRPPPSLTASGRAATLGDSWAFDESELFQSYSNTSDGQSGVNRSTSIDSTDNASPLQQPSTSTRGHRHQRTGSSIPKMMYPRGVSDSSMSSGPTGLTTPGERARYVALTMKAQVAQNAEGGDLTLGEGELPDLMNVLEAHRENDSLSEQRRSAGGGSKGSRSRSNSRLSASLNSHDHNSRGGSSGFSGGFRTKRPFSGISAAPMGNDGFMSNVDQLFEIAEHVQDLCQIPEGEEDEALVADLDTENANFLQSLFQSHPEVPDIPEDDEGETQAGEDEKGVDESTPLQIDQTNKARRPSPRDNIWPVAPSMTGGRFYKFLLWWAELRKQMRMLAVAFDLPFVKERLWSFFQNEVTMFIVPALAISAFFYYRLNNPIMAFMPTDASISWWILFAVRHYITLQLAYVSEYIFVDVMAMRSLVSVHLIGPLATLYTINAKGWPFVLTAWGVLNFLWIQEGHESSHSSHEFFNHWLYFTEIEMFTEENPSGGVVQSMRYKELLISMIIAGVATSLKRTVLALYLGKRIYIHYKPKLEKVMESMILLTEVADLGNAIDDFEFEKVDRDLAADQFDSKRVSSTRTSTRTSTVISDNIRTSTMNAFTKKEKVETIHSESDSDEEVDDDGSADGQESGTWNRFRAESHSSDEMEPVKKDVKTPSKPLENDDKKQSQEELDKTLPRENQDNHATLDTTVQEDFPEVELPPVDDIEPPVTAVHEPVRGLLQAPNTTTAHIKSLLDTWEEPVNKADKMADPTIHEILQFRKALSFLDDTHPFGSSFGPAFTRDTCIKSSKSLYKRLLALSPGSPVLHFDIIGVLAYNVDGTFDDKKAKSLVRLFRPDKFDEVSLLHFVQSCDNVYKRLRYLRASVGNSTLIDSVLENIFNGAFAFFLGLTIMSILQLNPWTLLVSMSTVLVSFAFALGPSVAKVIEGIIMIAVRRPFDLGDRISIVDTTQAADNSDDPAYHDTWFVEDCNLFTTTLRLSRTNEVSTVNNGSIANTRIVNHGRSRNALVNITLRIDLAATHEQIEIFKSALEQYIRDNPRVWACLFNMRIIKVDPANDLVVYALRIQHVKTWQDKLPVQTARGDIDKFCNEILMKLGIHYPCAVTTNNIRIKEMPVQNDIYPRENAQLPNESGPPSMPTEIHHEHYE